MRHMLLTTLPSDYAASRGEILLEHFCQILSLIRRGSISWIVAFPSLSLSLTEFRHPLDDTDTVPGNPIPTTATACPTSRQVRRGVEAKLGLTFASSFQQPASSNPHAPSAPKTSWPTSTPSSTAPPTASATPNSSRSTSRARRGGFPKFIPAGSQPRYKHEDQRRGRAKSGLHQPGAILRRCTGRGLGVRGGRLSGLAQVAQGSQGAETLFE